MFTSFVLVLFDPNFHERKTIGVTVKVLKKDLVAATLRTLLSFLVSISLPSALSPSHLFFFFSVSLFHLQIECDLCGHRCMTQEGLDLHRLSHTGQTPLKCPVRPCRRRFTSNSALEEHVLAHFQGTLSKSKNRPRFRCEICQKEFAYNSTFNVHMRTHTDERPFEVRRMDNSVCLHLKTRDRFVLFIDPLQN